MLNVALVGTGSFAEEHLRAFSSVPEARVKYVVGSDWERTQRVADLIPGAVASTDLARVLSAPDVDAVDICNKTAQHAPAAIAAARAGKHVHVDKPAALSVEDLEEMIQSAEAAGVTLMVGQTVRFQPIIQRVRQAVDRGAVGTPRLLHVSWYTGHVWPGGWRGWQLDVRQSGGNPVHNGTHLLDLAVWLLGSQPVEVFTRSFPTFAAGMPMHDSFSMIVRFANGSLATLELCYALRQRGDTIRRIVLAGDSGTVKHNTDDDPGLVSPSFRAPPPSTIDALTNQLRHWVRAIAGDESFVVKHSEMRATLATAIAAQQTLVSQQPVKVLLAGGVA